MKGKGTPGRHNGLDTCLQLNDPDLGVLVQVGGLDVDQVRPPSKAVGLTLIEGVEHLHCGSRQQHQIRASQMHDRKGLTPHRPDGYTVLRLHAAASGYVVTIRREVCERWSVGLGLGSCEPVEDGV